MLKPSYDLPALPLSIDLETVPVLRAASKAHRHLAELKGKAAAIPNQNILIDTLSLQEAKASSEIENIITTQDELFVAELFPTQFGSPAAKEVSRYRDALRLGLSDLQTSEGLITNNSIIGMFQLLKRTTGTFRTTPGTALKNDRTGETVYVPPQDASMIQSHMSELEKYINLDDVDALDPLIKMAIIHHQFESIHPFPDGNGRLGRILNVLYLTKKGLLEIPILYLSRAITDTKADYYRLLQSVRDDGNWEPWLIYMLNAVAESSITALHLVEQIRIMMADYKQRLRSQHPKIYSQDLLNNLFRHPYTKIDFVQQELSVTRQTASKYLDVLSSDSFLVKRTIGKHNYYMNVPLIDLFFSVSSDNVHEMQHPSGAADMNN